MSRIKRVFIGLLICFLFFFEASASVYGAIRYMPDTGALEISCRGLNAHQEYALMVLRSFDKNPSSLTDENALMVDQMKASDNGTINVLLIYPDLPECMVLLGGEFDGESSPIVFGEPISLTDTLYTPAMLTAIKDGAFAGTTFQSVWIGSSVTSIGAGAFKDCRELSSVIIPSSVTSIAGDAFAGCPNLEIVCIHGSAAHDFAVNHNIPFRLE